MKDAKRSEECGLCQRERSMNDLRLQLRRSCCANRCCAGAGDRSGAVCASVVDELFLSVPPCLHVRLPFWLTARSIIIGECLHTFSGGL